MDSHEVQLVGAPCGQHGPYTFYKAFRYTKNGVKRIVTLSEFFFVKMWRDSDLLCIGELQLLWVDKNSELTLASLRLYFLPENTPDGRMDHGEDEVLAISEKVVLRADDLATWITAEAEWTWGRPARCAADVDAAPTPPDEETAPPRRPAGAGFALHDGVLDLAEVDAERRQLESQYDEEECKRPHVVILSFPKYCRYRAMMKRLEGVEDQYLKLKVVNALGGFYVTHPNTRVLFCRDTFDYPELEGHEMLCNHLAPKLKGRPRGKRKKRSVSPCSESNESESSASNHYTRSSDRERSNSLRSDSPIATRRSARCHEHNENKQFVRVLTDFMRAKRLPMGRVPSLGYKELNLHEFYTKVQKLGGYDAVTMNKLWKNIFDDMTGHLNSTSAATVIRRHYERFLLAFERNERGEEYQQPVAERRRLNSRRRRSESSTSDSSASSEESAQATPTPSSPAANPQPQEVKEPSTPGKPSSLRSVRVKPERQKEKNKDKATSPDGNSNEAPTKSEGEETEPKPKIEKLIIKTESMTIVTSPPVKLESAIFEPTCELKSEVKREETECESKPDNPVANPPNPELDISKITLEPEKCEDDAPSPEKDPEPDSVPSPAQKISAENSLSPVEGKENIPVIKTVEPAPTTNGPEVIEIPFKAKPHAEVESFKTMAVKKIRLDILKEGGLEVTPVRPTLTPVTPAKDVRPSVIQPTAQIIAKPLKPEMMPPPSVGAPKRTHPPSAFSPIKIPTTPPKNKVDLFNFNGSTPPKVVQSNSIYSYSEKKVYGNPKDYLQETANKPFSAAVTPKVLCPPPKAPGVDPVDLSIPSPQKPIVEITRVAPAQTLQTLVANREAVAKNLHKTTSPSQLLEGRRLGTNLEITLVGPKSAAKAYNCPQPSHAAHIKYPTVNSLKRSSNDSYARTAKNAKVEENGRYKGSAPKLTAEINIPNPFGYGDCAKSPAQAQKQPPPAPLLPALPPYLGVPDGVNGIAPFFPLMDSLYYQAAVQSLVSGAVPPMLPVVPTAQQLKLYAELMARTGLSPFGLPPDGHHSLAGKKQ